MTYDYNVLEVDRTDEESTNNLLRKYNKLLKSFKNNPTKEKLDRINNIKEILYPPTPFIREKTFTNKKIIANFMRYIRNDEILRKQLDARIFTCYILLSNLFPDEVVKMIIKMCNFNIKGFVLDIPKDIYIFSRLYYKNNEKKEKIIESYKKNKQITNLIKNIHSIKKKQ